MEIREHRCIICGLPMEPSNSGEYYVCPSCQLAASGQKENPKIYNEKYMQTYLAYEESPKAERLKHIRKNWVLAFLGKRKFSLLDYGCCLGTFLYSLPVENNFLAGFDINPWAINFAKEKFKSIFFTETASSLMPLLFDAITMFDVIEHSQNPEKLLSETIRNQLLEDGLLFLSTPNSSIKNIAFLDNGWRHYKPNEHLFYFNSDSIKKLLNKCGFEIIKIDYRESIVRDSYEKNILCVTAKKK